MDQDSLYKVFGIFSFGVLAIWSYYRYHKHKLQTKEVDEEEKFKKSNILNTVNDVIVPWFKIVNDLRVKYPVSDPKVDIPNISPNYTEFELIDIIVRSNNVKQFRFKLDEDQSLDIPLGTHIQVQNKEGIKRSYTPITSLKQKGYFDLLVKHYEGGQVSSYLHALKIGDKVEMRGPIGGVRKKLQERFSKIGMIGGGTGITPLYQIMQDFFDRPDAHQISIQLLYSNQTENDILLKEELDLLSSQFNLQVYNILSRSGTKQRIDEHIIQQYFDISNLEIIFICGSLEFNKVMKSHLLSLNINPENIVTF